MPTRERLSGAVCDDIALNVQFLNNGSPADPAAICSVKIYKCSVNDENLVTQMVFPEPTDDDFDLSKEYIYDGMLKRCNDTSDPALCGTDKDPEFTPGCFILNLNLCPDVFDSGVYFDVWEFVGTACNSCEGTDVTDVTDITDITSVTESNICDDDSQLQSQCNKFYVNGRGWFVDDGLKNIRLGFEPLDKRFQQPEKRYLEVGLTPLPLYDYDSDKIRSILPSLSATITVQTGCHELLIDSEPMKIGLRQGSFRSNPYVIKYLFDTNRFLKGTYQYRVDVQLPDGQTRSSPYFTVAIR